MIEAVFVFGVMNAVFEFILLCMLPPRTRLRVLGDHQKKSMIHIVFLLLNLMVHWGTITGSMTAITAFVVSIGVVAFAKKLFGCIAEQRYYHVGWIKYSIGELK